MVRSCSMVLMVVAWAAAQEARVVVLSPKKADMLSKGEIGVMLDAIAGELDKNNRLKAIELKDMQDVLREKDVERVHACPDKTCIRGIGEALNAHYAVTLAIDQKGQPFEVELHMYDIETGDAIARMSGEYNGPKSQLVIKFLPRQTKELVKNALSAVEAKLAGVTAPPGGETKGPLEAEQVSEAQPAQGAARPKKHVLRSPAFWIPTAIALAAPVAIILYVRSNQEPDKDDDASWSNPDTPERPSTSMRQ
ncbi:MAG: hypothetical protein GF418_07525 [Chitinivibrionales bacterium]|nr:hypothetical protein [Chitinivibrionales bacterium]MBD3395462.1 hypothetical protein [Chitinivibrionales bacterium]